MYHGRNLGDTAIQMAVMQGLRAELGAVEFIGICADPADTHATHEIAAVHWWAEGPDIALDGRRTAEGPPPQTSRFSRIVRRPLSRWAGINRVVRNLDLLVVSGSGQIDDFWGGPWSQPFRLLLWTASARRHGVPVVVLGVGVDELSSRLGATFSVQALRLAAFRAFRDEGSLRMLRDLGMKAKSHVCPDP